jgi:hypothetical protein
MKKEFPKTKYLCEGLRLTILGCFRYSLGRMTYMPRHTLSIIKQHPDIFTDDDYERFIKEIQECENLGMECDKQTWNELIKFSKEVLEERRECRSQPQL